MQQKIEQQLDEIIKLIKEINKSLGGNNESKQSGDEKQNHHTMQD